MTATLATIGHAVPVAPIPDEHDGVLIPRHPHSAIVATARVVDVLPIVEREWCEDGFIGTRRNVAAVLPEDHPCYPEIHLWCGGQFDGFISDQLPYGDWTPGRWAWRLDDIEPCCDPIPAKGKQGVWRWTP